MSSSSSSSGTQTLQHHSSILNGNSNTKVKSPTKNKLNLGEQETPRDNKRIKLEGESKENSTANGIINRLESSTHPAAHQEATSNLNLNQDNQATMSPTETNNGSSPNQHQDIDESLYSRQLYVLGHEAMRRMQASNLLICGMGGLGLEIAKNIVLGGVKSVSIYDEQKVTHDDLATHFYLSEKDIHKNRAECTLPHLAELNTYVNVNVLQGPLTVDKLSSYQVVVLTESSLEQQIELGSYCHQHDIRFIVAQTRGVFGQIFCDFGEKFEVNDVDGEQPLSTMISAINNDAEGTVTTLDETRHGLEDGMVVTFSEVKGMTEVNGREFKIKVFGPYTFGIGDTKSFGNYIRGGYVHEVKKPRVMTFKPIAEAMKLPECLISDFTKLDDSNSTHLAFTALEEFSKQKGSLPRPWHHEDATEFVRIAHEVNKKLFNSENISDYILRLFASTARGQLIPMMGVIGGTAAQEVMKACSGKFTPISQYFYFDCRECLPEKPLFEQIDPTNYLVNDDNYLRYKAQIAVFGNQFQAKLSAFNAFLIGAGALGCEYLKNLAMMGACSGDGRLVITDMDTIEKSNLNRQFLFRSNDLQQPKSTVAARAAKRMNPSLSVDAHTNRVGSETEHIYNDSFFEGLDVVLNALDNVDARIYVDRRCVYYQKPLIESGTLGTKGNVQLVKPFMTESYSSTQDPPEKSIPFCTLKNFPNAIEHTLQWARDAFGGMFTNPAMAAVEFIRSPSDYIDRVTKLQGSQPFDELSQVYRVLSDEKPNSFTDCVKWARFTFQDFYHNTIEQLLYNFPRDQLTSSGVPFWSGPKRCPHSLDFSVSNPTHLEFVYAAANLKAQMYGFEQVRNKEKVAEILSQIQVPAFKPKQGVKIHTSDAEAQNASSLASVERDQIEELVSKLKALTNTLQEIKIEPIEFEKDDDNNLHMDFIVACSNLRAENYDIAPADRHKSKLIAGRIIPAIATTTALIVGLDCIELYKLIQGHEKIEFYRNTFVNLALPFFGMSEPVPPKKSKYYENEFTLWDRFEVKGEMTLKEFLDYFQREHKLEITMLSQGVTMLYAFFMDKKKLAERLNMPLSEVVKSVSKKDIPSHVGALVLEMCCNDADGEDLEVPYVKYVLPK